LCAGAFWGVGLEAWGAPALLPGDAPKTPVEKRLKAEFDALDLDKNTFLDKEELAKAFRGPKAKPPTQGMYDDQGRLTKTYYEAKTKYPDLVFLWAADKDNDKLVSWPEYRDYELKVLAAQKQMQQALQRSLQSIRRRTSTASRRHVRTVYRRSSSSYSHPTRHVQNLQRSYASQQQQMVRAVQNWQNNQRQMQIAYQTAVRNQMLQQQRVVNYVRQQQVAYYRAAQRHMQAVYQARRRR
jgi:hypothetical protein